MQNDPLISLVLPVKNGLPHLERAVAALRRQTYRNFELIVQDGGSTDGSLQYLESAADLGRVEIVSQPDAGIGQAYNRGMSRATGDLLLLIACDEWLDDDALQKVAGWFCEHPTAAVVYGSMRLADAEGRIIQMFVPPAFELEGVIRNEIVVPAGASCLSRATIGADLYYDESLKTCPDYDFWIRLGKRFGADGIVRVLDPIVTARGDRASQSFRAESFEQFCRDKLVTLNRRVESQDFRRSGSAGIFTWAAENVYQLEGNSPLFLKLCSEAAKFDPASPRLRKLASRTQAFDVDPSTGEMIPRSNLQPARPEGPTERVEGLLSLDELRTFEYWKNATVERADGVQVVTGAAPWSFAAHIPFNSDRALSDDNWYWIRLDVEVVSGQIGIGLFANNDISDEQVILPSQGRTEILVRILQRTPTSLMIRNGSLPELSVVRILGVGVESSPRPGQRDGAVRTAQTT